MPQSLEAPPPKPKRGRHKDDRLEVRLDPELMDQARQKAASRGVTLGTAIRALLLFWMKEDHLDNDDLAAGQARAEQRGSRSTKKK